MTPGAFAAQLTWPDLERRVQAGAVGVLPVGAACKQHGPHLPMNTDLLQAEWLAGELVRRAEVLVWPTVSYGHYPAFTDYPGSVSLKRETFQSVVEEILGDIRRSGIVRILIVNTGISTIEPLQSAVGAMPGDVQIGLANVYQGPRYRAVATEVEQQPRGGHADELETSILLAIAREAVDLETAQAWTPASLAANVRFNRADRKSAGFSPSGVFGDPTLAGEDKGRRLLDAMVEDLLAAVGELSKAVDREQ